MKIEGQLTTPNYLYSGNHAQGLDFENWINNPTKQTSGDEYYWQHQNQLQQSDLKFQSQLADKNESNIAVMAVEPIGDNPATVVEIKDTHEPNHSINYEPEFSVNNKSRSMQLERTIVDLQQQLQLINTIATPMSVTIKITNVLPTAAINGCRHTQNNIRNLKYHHLFIEGNHAELTLNTSDLNANEEIELTQMIQDNLKNKGLILSHLIVNGVKK